MVVCRRNRCGNGSLGCISHCITYVTQFVLTLVIQRSLYTAVLFKYVAYYQWLCLFEILSYSWEFLHKLYLFCMLNCSCSLTTHMTVEMYNYPRTLRGGADKSLARPGRKQATAAKLGIYSTYTPRNSVHFLARCSTFCKPLKKKSERCPSKQVSAAAMGSASDEKWRPFNYFFQSREQVVVRRDQIRRIG